MFLFEKVGLKQLRVVFESHPPMIELHVLLANKARLDQRLDFGPLHVMTDVIIERGHHLSAALLAGRLKQRRENLLRNSGSQS
jgi:hypothetical protein